VPEIMTAEEAVRGAAGPVGRLGGAWMFDEVTQERGTALGLKGWSWYHCGRGGVLGDGDASVVVAAFGFFPPALQRKAWDRGRAVLPVREISAAYAEACADWGRRTFTDVPSSGRLADLLFAAADAVEPAGIPVFAGWRALAPGVADDDPARLALALQVMREHRGGLHLVAVVAEGVDPLQAVVSGRYGPSNAEFFGWPQPWPDPEVGRAAMTAAEARTDALVRPAFAALGAEDRAELVEGLRGLPR
jgi:hypothetical protein